MGITKVGCSIKLVVVLNLLVINIVLSLLFKRKNWLIFSSEYLFNIINNDALEL